MEYHSFLFVSDLIMSIKILENGFRLLMELYSFLLIFATEDESEFFQVSVSLWSIIHSYFKYSKLYTSREWCISFRLLTELYSFLPIIKKFVMKLLNLGFRLLTELYSFLQNGLKKLVISNVNRFPSPYGVIFILTSTV